MRDGDKDGKLLDDVGEWIAPNLPEVPDPLIPFPGPIDGALPGYEDPSPCADSGEVHEPELANTQGNLQVL
ncbi:hypothetical protein AB0O76_04785 [Streptomyces sp. NPDC086554]|uniref:hypothetical protein n=1 Tax=Streptomyces sp. NPDC086554 TaxID=3154864 RepID=UPI003428C9E3